MLSVTGRYCAIAVMVAGVFGFSTRFALADEAGEAEYLSACASRHNVSGETSFTTCADDQLSVIAASQSLAALACNLAIKAKTRITECGLVQTAPIQIRLMGSLRHDFGECLATYNRASNDIEVTDPGFIEAALRQESPYRVLPTGIVFQALISHEMAHALLEQTTRTDLAFVDHEYVAAAMELDILDPKWRTALIRAAPVSLPPKIGLISELIYGFEPRKFATNAWQHFNSQPDGCARIRAIAAGEFSFSEPRLK